MQPHRIHRRTFLLGAGAGLAAGLGGCNRQGPAFTSDPVQPPAYTRKQFTGKTKEVEKPEFPLPGRFPGRVVEVHHDGSVVHGTPQLAPIRAMLSRAMRELTGAPDAVDAWRSFFQKGDRVGIKVNPVGYARQPGVVGVISNFATILAVVEALQQCGLATKDVVLFERYGREFCEAGYDTFLERELPGVGWYASAWTGGDHRQIELDGRDPDASGRRHGPDPHVVGYDKDVFRKLDYRNPENPADDGLSYQSHVSRILTGDLVNKVITLPLLKDHRSGGITIALKNMSHGMVSNVARSHLGEAKDGGNTCGEFIPTMVALPPIRQKCVLHIMDALIGVYEGGPGTWNRTWGTWEYQSLFVATDPVAMDHVGWDVLDAERARRWWPRVGEMGKGKEYKDRFGAEQFYRRQPEHVELAGDPKKFGLGAFDPAQIEYRRVVI